MMSHLTDGMLTAYLDGELPPHDRKEIITHVSQCEPCRTRLDAAQAQRTSITSALGALSPIAADAPNARRALANLRANPKYRKETGIMSNMSRKNRRALIGVVSLLAVIGLFALAPVRALASDFLSLFRVERFVVVDVDPERIAEIAEAVDEGMYLGDFEQIDDAGATEVATLDEAADLAGFAPRTVSGYGDPVFIGVTDAMSQSFTPDIETLQQVFVTLGLDPELLPEDIDGETFTFSVDAGVAMGYTDGEADFAFMQVPSPTIEGTEEADVQALGEAMLQLLGMTPDEAARLSETIDFTSTLVVPIPTDLASVAEVNVDGATGLLFDENVQYDNHGYGESHGGMLLWQKDGMLYVLGTANVASTDLLSIAGALN